MARKMKRPFLLEEQVCHATNIRVAVRRTRSVKNLNIFYFIFHHKPLSEIQCACASTRSEEIINKSAANMHVCAGTYSFLSPKYLVYSDKKGVLFRTKFYSFFFSLHRYDSANQFWQGVTWLRPFNNYIEWVMFSWWP